MHILSLAECFIVSKLSIIYNKNVSTKRYLIITSEMATFIKKYNLLPTITRYATHVGGGGGYSLIRAQDFCLKQGIDFITFLS